jgi:hypothetical protein
MAGTVKLPENLHKVSATMTVRPAPARVNGINEEFQEFDNANGQGLSRHALTEN